MRVKTVFLAASAVFAISVPASSETTVAGGGTLLIDGKPVKLWGVEVPLPGRICTTSTGREWACGDRARDQLAEVIAADAPICESKGDNAVLCRVVGLDIGLLLVKEGLAWSRGGYDEAEMRAKEARIGLWE
ncbi:hypothetical protein QBK99_17385 [Corticibacterium sp. UT-5YL-CI-8]|nr:hypothetical protein [Tianweitania sp. UT-5YL-CI-8]